MKLVLITANEQEVCVLVSDMLARGDYESIIAMTPNDAISIGRNEKRPIHLLIADIKLDHIDGKELAARLRFEHKDLRTLFMSSFAPPPSENATEFIQKPFTVELLNEKVQYLVGTPDS